MRTLLLAASVLTLALTTAVPATVANPDGATKAALALAPVPPGRLTDAARPLYYRIDLTVNPDLERFSGKVEIDIVVKRSSTFIDLRGRDLKMASAVAVVGGERMRGDRQRTRGTGFARPPGASP